MFSLADVYSSCRNCVTAKLQKASSQPGSSRMAFSQFMAAFSGMPRLKYASARFLQKQCFLLYFRHFSRTTMDYEYLPSLFRAAARLLWRCRVTQNSSALSQIFSKMASHTSRHSLARQLSRQRQDKYSAADRLLGEYFSAALSSSMALSLSDFKAQQNKSKEFLSFFSRTITSLFYYSLSDAFFWLGISVSVSSFNYSFTSGKATSSCLIVSTTFKAIPKPVVFCLSILLLFLKIGDWISSKLCLLAELVEMGTLQTLFVTVQFSCSALLMTGGAGMRLLMSSATLMPPFWKRVSKMFCQEALFDEAQDLQSSLLMDSLILSLFVLFQVFTLPQQARFVGSFTSALVECTFFSYSSAAFDRASSFLAQSFSFQLYLEENMVYRICFFLSQTSLNSFSLSTSPNFISIPSSIDDRLLLNLFAFSYVVSLPYFSQFSTFGSNKATGTIELALPGPSASFLPMASETMSLLGVALFSFWLSSLVSLFFMRDDDLVISSSLLVSSLKDSASFSDCLATPKHLSFSLIMDSQVSISLFPFCTLTGSLSFKIGSLLSSFAMAQVALTIDPTHQTSLQQACTSSFFKFYAWPFLVNSWIAFRSFALIFLKSLFLIL